MFQAEENDIRGFDLCLGHTRSLDRNNKSQRTKILYVHIQYWRIKRHGRTKEQDGGTRRAPRRRITVDTGGRLGRGRDSRNILEKSKGTRSVQLELERDISGGNKAGICRIRCRRKKE